MSTTAFPSVRQGQVATNNLLAALKPGDRALLAPNLEPVSLTRDDILFDSGDPVTTIHFPCDAAMVSLIIAMDPDHAVETATIGREGAVGGVVSHGSLPAFTRAVVQTSGPALRLPLAALQEAKAASSSLRNLFYRYGDCLLSQVLQSVACNALHSIDQRCAKWLLSSHDRVGEDNLQLTHEALAQMLGVQRSYISKVLGRFQRQGLVEIKRGKIALLRADELHDVTCECYDHVKEHFESVLSGVYPNVNLSTAV